MENQLIKQVTAYVETNISNFHQSRINKLSELKLKTVLKKKNPYLFKAKYYLTAAELVTSIANAFISSAEETIFGDWLEGLAIFVCDKVYGGQKSSTIGVDLEFSKDGIRYIIAIKSGPNWGNSSQIAKMRADFITAKRTLRTSRSYLNIVSVNGCCYGTDNNPDKGDYFKYCGQEFWSFISGEDTLYIDIIEPLATKAKERNDEYEDGTSDKGSGPKMLNKITSEFIKDFCSEDGAIDWVKLVEFNSGKK